MAEEDLADPVFETRDGRQEGRGVAQGYGVHAANADREVGVVHEQQHRFVGLAQASAQPCGAGLAVDAPGYVRLVGIEKQCQVVPEVAGILHEAIVIDWHRGEVLGVMPR